MKVFVGIVDRQTGISQYGMIDESIQKGFEIANALGHFGVNINTVKWQYNQEAEKVGIVEDTNKIINIVTI